MCTCCAYRNIGPSRWRWFPVPELSKWWRWDDDDDNDEPFLKKLCVLLCMLQNALECASEYVQLQQFPKEKRATGQPCSLTPLPLIKIRYNPGNVYYLDGLQNYGFTRMFSVNLPHPNSWEASPTMTLEGYVRMTGRSSQRTLAPKTRWLYGNLYCFGLAAGHVDVLNGREFTSTARWVMHYAHTHCSHNCDHNPSAVNSHDLSS